MGKKVIRRRLPRSNYTVGYGKPPKRTRFRPGQSGNPAGRPKGSRNASSLAKLALERRITVDHNGRRQRMTVREFACLRLAEKAAEGDLKALDYLLMLAGERQASEGGGSSTPSTTEQDIAAIDEFIARWLKRKE